MGHFAWDIRGGDTVYVADSGSVQVVGVGSALAQIGELAYRFDALSPIVSGGDRWCHLIDVDWDDTFKPFRYENPRAAPITVLKLKLDEVREFDGKTVAAGHRDAGLMDEEVRGALLLEDAYSRYTPAQLRLIHREHVEMSNKFILWLRNAFGVDAVQERQQIDATFEINGRRYLVEFKIAYHGDTRRAIREALGQILEYNHYPERVSYDQWVLILDTSPDPKDLLYLACLRSSFHFPLRFGWKTNSGFDFDPPLHV